MKRLLLALMVFVPSTAFAQSETIEYYGHDGIGSIRIVFNVNGTVLARQDYAPFGRPLFTAPAMPKEGFGAQEKDDETDQSNFHARMFQGRTGRFARPDPIGAGLFRPQGWNRYAYASNSPLGRQDFWGLSDCPPNQYCEVVNVPGDPTYRSGLPTNGDDGMKTIPEDPEEQPGSAGSPGTPPGGDPPGGDPPGGCLSSSSAGCEPPKPPPGPPKPPPCTPKGPTTIVTASLTSSGPTTLAAAAFGGAVGGPFGALVGGLIGNFLGLGPTGSYVPSTNTAYVGFAAVFSPAIGGGTGASLSAVHVPAGQNPNAIANGLSYSGTWQPTPLTGSTVVKSRGSRPVAGVSLGTRVPVSFGVSYNFLKIGGGCS